MTLKPEPETEPVKGDEAAIGRAYRWSLVSFIFIIAAAGVALLVADRGSPPANSQHSKPLTNPIQTGAAAVPETLFHDITAQSGIRFTHVNGAYGDKLLPETMGGGCAFFDFDNDGHQDLLLV